MYNLLIFLIISLIIMLFIKYFFCYENFSVTETENLTLDQIIDNKKVINLITSFDGKKYILSTYPKSDCSDYDKTNDCLANILVLVNYDEYQENSNKLQEDSIDDKIICKIRHHLQCIRNINKKKKSEVSEVIEPPTQVQIEQFSDESSVQSSEQSSEQPIEQPIEQAIEQPIDQAIEQPQDNNKMVNIGDSDIPIESYPVCINTLPACQIMQYNNTEFSLVKTKPNDAKSKSPAYKLIGSVNSPEKKILKYAISTAGEFSISNLVCLDGNINTENIDPTSSLELIKIPNQSGSENKYILKLGQYELIGGDKKLPLHDKSQKPVIKYKYIGLCKSDFTPNSCTIKDKKYSRLCLYDKEDNAFVLQFQLNIVNTSK